MNRPASVLVVDDNVANRQTLHELLEAEGYRIAGAADGPAALRLAAEEPPDIVLLDVMMPGMDGFEVCRRLRATPCIAEVPVIFITALDDHASRIVGLEAGADDFITKPFNRVELRARVRTITRLNRYRRLQESQAATHASDERYRNLFNTMDEGFCVIEVLFDPQGQAVDYRFLEVNPSFAMQSGLVAAPGKTVRELIPDIEAIWIQRFAAVALTGESTRFVNRVEGLDRWFDIHAFRLGRPESRHVAVLFNDISARMLAEQRLRASEARFRALFNLGPIAVYSCDEMGLITEFNRRAVELWGWKPKPGENYERYCGSFKLFRPDGTFMPHAECPMAQVVNGKIPEVKDEEIVIERPDGSRFTGLVNITPLKNEQGEITGAINCIQNITERKKVETALRESEQWLRAVFDQAAVGVAQIDAATMRYVRTNQRFCDMTGYRHEELKLLSPAEIIYPQDASVDLENFVRMRDGSITEFMREKRYVRKDGAIIWVSVAVSVIGTYGEVPAAFIAVMQDITERKEVQEQLLRTQRLDNLGMLAAGIAHDFNNALAPIIMSGPLLQESLRSDGNAHRDEDADGTDFHAMRKHEVNPGAQRLLNIVAQCAERGAGLVRQLLSFARGANGERQLLQSHHVLKEVSDLAEVTFPKRIHVSVELPGNLWPIQANATQIHQVILNLCVNARDAMPAGGELILTAANCTLDAAAAAEIADARPGNFLVIEVKDNGEGIPPAVLHRIWDPFFSTKGESKGTGLGLFTVRGIVKQHDGFVTIRTRAGEGTVFTVFLPADARARDGDVELDRPKSARGRDELILVVDDEENVRTVAAQILNRHGYRTITACDGAEAIAVFAPRATEVRLLLTDLQMPLLDGPALAKALRRLRPDLPIVAMSGAASKRSNASHKEFTPAYIAKPFQTETLLSMVRDVLDANPSAVATAAAN